MSNNKAFQISAVFIFVMGLYLIFSHGYVSGLLFIVAANTAYRSNDSVEKISITSMSRTKRFALVFLLLVISIYFLPNPTGNNNPDSMASTTSNATHTPEIKSSADVTPI
jgi:uncharacterized membrane protein